MTHKFGIRLTKTVAEAFEIDIATPGMDFWRKAISNKERMAKVKIAWKTSTSNGLTPQQAREGKAPELIGFQEIGCHIIFDVNKMDFKRKARFVAGGHMTTAPSSMTYSSVVSRDSIRLAFLIVALNDLDIMSYDLENAYLNAPACREKIWFEGGGIECGEDYGKVCIVVCSLKGLKSASGAAFRSSLPGVDTARCRIPVHQGRPR
jgi:hypothetical protein